MGAAIDLPGDVREYLHETNRLNRDRDGEPHSQALQTARAQNPVGVVQVLLEGIASPFSYA